MWGGGTHRAKLRGIFNTYVIEVFEESSSVDKGCGEEVLTEQSSVVSSTLT